MNSRDLLFWSQHVWNPCKKVFPFKPLLYTPVLCGLAVVSWEKPFGITNELTAGILCPSGCWWSAPYVFDFLPLSKTISFHVDKVMSLKIIHTISCSLHGNLHCRFPVPEWVSWVREKKRCAWDRCLSCTCLKSTPSFVGFFHELLLGALDATEKEAGHTWKAPWLAMDGWQMWLMLPVLPKGMFPGRRCSWLSSLGSGGTGPGFGIKRLGSSCWGRHCDHAPPTLCCTWEVTHACSESCVLPGVESLPNMVFSQVAR